MGGCVSTNADLDIHADGKNYHLKRLIATGFSFLFFLRKTSAFSGFSQIWLAEDTEKGDKFAVKKVFCHGQTEFERTRREINVCLLFAQSSYKRYVFLFNFLVAYAFWPISTNFALISCMRGTL